MRWAAISVRAFQIPPRQHRTRQPQQARQNQVGQGICRGWGRRRDDGELLLRSPHRVFEGLGAPKHPPERTSLGFPGGTFMARTFGVGTV